MTYQNKQLSTYKICQICESLLSPDYKVCPVCGQSETGTERHVYQILPHVVCGNCGSLVSELADVCPFCDAPMNSFAKREIVEQPVEFEIVEMDM